MRLYYAILLICMSGYGMVNHFNAQDPNICPLIKLPISITSYILSYVIAPCLPLPKVGRFMTCYYTDKTKRARSFLTTCKYYYTSKELTRAIITQLGQEHGLGRAFVFSPLFLSTPTSDECLKEWLQITSEVPMLGYPKLIPSKEKIESLDQLLKDISHAYPNKLGLHLTNKIMTIKSLVQQIA